MNAEEEIAAAAGGNSDEGTRWLEIVLCNIGEVSDEACTFSETKQQFSPAIQNNPRDEHEA